MKFQVDRERGNGLVLIDRGSMKELDDELLYAFDILLDRNGLSELIYDFPDEDWHTVWVRETEALRNFCNSGKMIVWLFDEKIEFETIYGVFQTDDALTASDKWLYAPTGDLLAVTASELIQCLSYPELERFLRCPYQRDGMLYQTVALRKSSTAKEIPALLSLRIFKRLEKSGLK